MRNLSDLVGFDNDDSTTEQRTWSIMPHQARTALLAVRGIIQGIIQGTIQGTIQGIYHALNNLHTKAIMHVVPRHAEISLEGASSAPPSDSRIAACLRPVHTPSRR